MKNMPTEKRKLSHSQNFLKSPELVRNLIAKTNLKAGDLVVEIGSGKGIITRSLAEMGCRVIGIELDSELVASLRKQFETHSNVEIVNADFLHWKLPSEKYKVFSNIPFNRTTDIITKLLSTGNPPEATYVILQDKAADRFIGDPVAKDTQVSILLKPDFDMAVLFNIDRKEFTPVPKIDAVLAKFEKREVPLVEKSSTQLFRDFVIYAFNQWKPTVLEALEKVFSHKQRSILEKKEGLRGAKPSELKIHQWLLLFDSFCTYVAEDGKNIVRGSEKKLRVQQSALQKSHRTRTV